MSVAAQRSRNVVRVLDSGKVEVSKRKRIVRAIWSTDECDHYRTCFVMTGIDTSTFDKNPQILAEHGKGERGMLPVATAQDYGPDRFKNKNVFVGSARFWSDDEGAERLFSRYASGEMRGWSINATPLESSPPTPMERRARPDWGDCELVYRHVRLLEVSAVSIPGNPSTLTLSVERGASPAAVAAPSPMDDPDPRRRYAKLCRLERELESARAFGRIGVEDYRASLATLRRVMAITLKEV